VHQGSLQDMAIGCLFQHFGSGWSKCINHLQNENQQQHLQAQIFVPVVSAAEGK